METFEEVISLITYYFSFIYPLLYLKGFVSNGKAFKIFTIYLLVISVIQLFSKLVIKVWELDSNLFLSHYYFIFQFVLLSLFYVQLLRFKWIYYVLGLVMVFLAYQYINDPSLYFRYNAIGMFLTHVLIVAYALVYLYKSLDGKKEFTIVNIGIFIYLLSSSLIFASGNLVFNIDVPESFSDLLIYINKFLFFVFQILIFTEWYRNYRKRKVIPK